MRAILASLALCTCVLAHADPKLSALKQAPQRQGEAAQLAANSQSDRGLEQKRVAESEKRSAAASAQAERCNDAAACDKEPPETYVAFGKSLKVTDTFIALFTLVIAIFTIGLFWEAKQTSKKELRAYVGVSRAFFRRTTMLNSLVAEIEIKNSGKTFAKELRAQWDFRIANLPVVGDPHLENPTRGVLMPDLFWNLHQEVPARGATLGAIREGMAVPVIEGRIEYTDAFNVPRWTTFRFEAGRNLADGWDVQAVDEGEHRNDAS